MPLFRKKLESSGPLDFLVVGLGNPGQQYVLTRHNIGFEVAAVLSRRWQLPRGKKKFAGIVTSGRIGPGQPRAAVLVPQTFMNDAGRSVGPAMGSFKLVPEQVIVIHDEIDLPFGEVQTRLGGGLAGHNGLKSIKAGLGSQEFYRVRVGVGRPNSSDPDVVSAYVLGKFRESKDQVVQLVSDAADETERLVNGLGTSDLNVQ